MECLWTAHRMVAFVTMLCSDVWNVICNVWMYRCMVSSSILANVKRSVVGLYDGCAQVVAFICLWNEYDVSQFPHILLFWTKTV